ncbi:efflux RND transporter permease subunit [Aliifodinibius sp. S!AR15-10]|uniref:efflux RND transporter permease subunit n=1 Tax=Aliifodinibius sp. S!AR15-10 TaxID=2950437 RepID=UPI00285F92BE|nr:efflux RND transporter permease subunit [Aliifodinibius sp. S!AR15-10]MDR8391803.1 efflux RND transporter permease subunit [Aliifodinibius sp. S!AR15-10]
MKIIDLSIRRKVTIAMFTIGILMFGFVSLSRLKVNLLPELNYPTLTIRTEYEGAAPAEVENLISKPVEEALGVVKDVQQVRSISRSGQSDVTLEFAWGTNMDFASIDVREKLDALQLPLEAERPVILRFDPTLDPIMRYALYTENAQPESPGVDFVADQSNRDDNFDINNLKRIRRFADEQIKKELESVPGVASVKVSGGLEEEIQVSIDQQRLSHLKIPIEEVTQILSAENVNLSGGRLEEGTQQYLVRTLNQFQTIDQIRNVVVTIQDGTPVYLKDIADVSQGYKEREAITRLDGKEAVEIAIYKEGDANTVAVANNVKSRLSGYQDNLPAGMQMADVYDQSTFISSAVSEVVDAGIIGGILAVIILYLFLRNFWATVIISLSIPVSIIATFNLMYGNDITLNIMSLGGIALGIGLLVDNSIVVLENISRHRDMGKSALQAAKDGAGEVGTAVIASTLTTIAVFFPLVFVQGIAGQLFSDQAITVTFSLLASLVVAITLIPMLSSLAGREKESIPEPELTEPKTKVGRWLRAARLFVFVTVPKFIIKTGAKAVRSVTSGIMFVLNPLLNGFEKGYNSIESQYPAVIGWALRRKYLVVVMAFGLLIATLSLVPQLGVELIPSLSQGEFRVEFKMPPGTPIEKTDAALKGVQQAASSVQRVNTTFAVAGTGNKMDANPEEGGENWGELNVVLADGADRTMEEQTMEELRTDLQRIPGLQYKFSRPALFTFRTPVEVEISGYDLEKLKQVSAALAREMSENGRFADVKSTMEQGSPEIQILFDRPKAAALGLQVHEVADLVVSKVRGDVATRYSWRDRKIDILVRAREQDRSSVDDIRGLIINPNSAQPVPLESIADIRVATGPSEIRRVAQQRVALVTANLNYGDLGTAAEEIQQIINQTAIPPGLTAHIAGQNEEMSASFQSLLFALILAVFLVYLVMASQFESLMHPFIILFTIPLALIGAIIGLWVTGSTISVVVFIGLILLVGIVVNNAIVLIDLINQLRERGMEKLEAIVEGGRSRLRPILMTTLTTTLGLFPLALGFGDGAELRAPMAITVIGGLIISTLLTLVVIPSMYAIMDRKNYSMAAENSDKDNS